MLCKLLSGRHEPNNAALRARHPYKAICYICKILNACQRFSGDQPYFAKLVVAHSSLRLSTGPETCPWGNTNQSVSVVTIQLLKSKKLSTWIWKNNAMNLADAELEVAPGHTDAATGGNQPQMLTEEIEEEDSLTANFAALGLKGGVLRELISQPNCEVKRRG